MKLDPRTPPRPPRLLRLLARWLIRGRHASFILPDLDASFTRDLERGLGRVRATMRYTSNILASVWSVWATGAYAIMASGIGLDVRLGLRMLARQRLVTVVAGLTLALGIPASLTIVHAFEVLYGDLPVEDADRVVGMRHYDVTTQRPLVSTLHDYEAWTELASYDAVGAVRSYRVNVTSQGAAGAPILAAEVTASSFDILRAGALRGRVLEAGDAGPGALEVALIGEDLWGDRFSRDPDIIGRTIRLGRTSHTIIGVMPADFGFPLAQQVWLPLRARAIDFTVGEGPGVFVFGRLADGVAICSSIPSISFRTFSL